MLEDLVNTNYLLELCHKEGLEVFFKVLQYSRTVEV